jgi:hypothetical protein
VVQLPPATLERHLQGMAEKLRNGQNGKIREAIQQSVARILEDSASLTIEAKPGGLLGVDGTLAQVECQAGQALLGGQRKLTKATTSPITSIMGGIVNNRPVVSRKAIQDYDGLTGTIRKFVQGAVVKPVQFQVVTNGTFRRHGVVDTPEVIPPPVRQQGSGIVG